MAIEIISRKHLTETKYTIGCRTCGAELRYTQSDAEERVEEDNDGRRYVVRYVACPDCGTRTIAL